MPAASSGKRPFGVFEYGPGQSQQWAGPHSARSLPTLDPRWAIDEGDDQYTEEQVRDLIRQMQDIPARMDEMTSLTMAMNGCYALSVEAAESVKKDVLAWVKLRDKIQLMYESDGALDNINLSPDGLPMIKADVVEWSDKMLGCCGEGGSYLEIVLAPFKEALMRLVMRVCVTLDLCSYDLEAPCCGLGGMHGGSYITPLVRS